MANKKNTKKNHHEDAPEKKHAQSNNKGIKIRYEWGKKKKNWRGDFHSNVQN